jgi:hypothetical protein
VDAGTNGAFAVAGLAMETNAVFAAAVNAQGACGRLNVGGVAALNGARLALAAAAAPPGDATLIANAGGGAVAGAFEGLPEGTTTNVAGTAFRITYVGGDGNDVVLRKVGAEPPATLRVITAHGAAIPPVGVYTNDSGTSVTCRVSRVEGHGGTQYVCRGWSLSGGQTPASGATTNFAMSHTRDTVLTWLWTTNYLFGRSAGPNGAVNGATGGWYVAGSALSVTAAPARYYRFTEWTGDVSGGEITANPLDLVLGWARAVRAAFEARRTANTGTPEWWLAKFGLTNDFEAAATNDPDHDGAATWKEHVADTDPTNGLSYLHVVSVTNRPPWTVYFGSSTARLYRLERSTNLTLPGGWHGAGGPTSVWGTGGTRGLTDTNAARGTFYRIRVEQP